MEKPPIASVRYAPPVTFAGPAGTIEGLWADPGRGLPAAVICHPHPAHGGSMRSKVVHTVFRVLDNAGHPTLRFNFRGVGRSAGRYSGWNDEVRDIAAAAAYVRECTGKRALWGAGFSFGAWAGLQWAMGDRDVERFLAIGLPVDNHAFEFLDRVPCPLVVIQGEHDQYGNLAGIEALRKRLEPTGPVAVRVVRDADHFFTDKLEELERAIEEIL